MDFVQMERDIHRLNSFNNRIGGENMNEIIKLSNTTLVVTFRCNLKCKLCAVSAPYYKEPPHYSVELLKKSIDRYFEAVDHVDKFTVNGGEPLVHPQIAEIMDYALKYIDRMDMLEIITNGSIAPSKELAQVLQKSEKVDILIDDYGKELSKNVDKMIGIFEEYHIKYRRRKYYGSDAHLGGWVDLSNISLKDRSEEDTAQIYKNCAYPGPFHCFVLMGGKAYICGVYKRCVSEGVIPDIEDEYVDFLNDSWNPEVTKKKIANFYNRKFFSACKYCSGFCPDSERFAPAEQLR